jgi:branched-subunit amino acid aminotransferase/4-amino-4-deoxychorismate lyase
VAASEALAWLDGRLVPARELPPGDEARACYSTARWSGAGVRFEARHRARLARDAAGLGLAPFDPELARRAFHELGRAVFGRDEGIVRLAAYATADGSTSLVATTRPLGPEKTRWRAIVAPWAHDGAAAPRGAKLARRPLYTRAAERAAERGADEALLFDADGRLVEGARANLVAVDREGTASVPPAERGAVAGVALELCEAGAARGELARRDVTRAALADLRELVALNAVRGAVAIVEIDGRPVGDGRPGPVSARLAAILAAAP